MSTHPNAILLLTLTPDDLPMKTLRAILEDEGIKIADEAPVVIGTLDDHYKYLVLESDYDESWQLSGTKGDILFHSFLTYGYGETIPWSAVQRRYDELDQWAQRVCEKHHCNYNISITANYW